ncbi:MAG: hypothetical protein Q7T78_11620, partial [Rhodoferax sp.]|nr:hypothetical protein [Rhodoferax sp.]
MRKPPDDDALWAWIARAKGKGVLVAEVVSLIRLPMGSQTRSSQIPGHLLSQRACTRFAAVFATFVTERSGDASERPVARP